jgi:hypothetical protein
MKWNENCSHMDEIVICESGACDTLLHWVTPYSIDIIWLISGTLFVGYHIRKKTPQIYFYQETVRRLWVILIRIRRWNLWVVGISKWRHHPQQQQQTTSMADVTSVWHLFDSNVRIVEWFSWLIIKTVLDRYRQVVNTNTCVLFYRYRSHYHISLPTYSKTNKNQALLVWQQQLVATRRTTSPSSQGCDVIHWHFILCTCKHLYF